VVSYREGSNAEPEFENVMSSAQSQLKTEHEIKLSDAGSVVHPAGSESKNVTATLGTEMNSLHL
jgi:hypothetical protein